MLNLYMIMVFLTLCLNSDLSNGTDNGSITASDSV